MDSSKSKTNWNIRSNPENKYIFQVNNRNTKRRCKIIKVNNNDRRAMAVLSTKSCWIICWQLWLCFAPSFGVSVLTLDMYLLAGIDQYNTAHSKEVSNQGTALFPAFLGGYSTFPNRKKVPCKLSSQFTLQQSWLRNEHSHFQMYTCLQLRHSYKVFYYLNM